VDLLVYSKEIGGYDAVDVEFKGRRPTVQVPSSAHNPVAYVVSFDFFEGCFEAECINEKTNFKRELEKPRGTLHWLWWLEWAVDLSEHQSISR
jgi:hypothetical protein